MERLLARKKFAIYSRKSKLTEKGESIENQVEMCKFLLKQRYDDISLEEDIINEIKRLKEVNKEIKIEMYQNDLEEGFSEKDYAKLMLDIISEYREKLDIL